MEIIFLIIVIAGIITWCIYRRNKAEELRRIEELKEEQRRKALELQQKKLSFVRGHSKCIHALYSLNKKWNFKNFNANPRYKRSCNIKFQLDNFNIDSHMLLTIEHSPSYFIGIVKAVKYNRQKYAQYEQQFNSILNTIMGRCDYCSITQNSIISVKEFKSIELEECKKLKKTVIRDFTIELIVQYKSNMGRNSYSQSYKFHCSDIEYYLNQYNQMEQNKQSAVYQRQLMTRKLRYQILKRDGFKCVICGRSQKDGAKLHVDHIKPVSKGGKTEESNLRTLCDMCNLGKSDAYDPYGLN